MYPWNSGAVDLVVVEEDLDFVLVSMYVSFQSTVSSGCEFVL